MLAVKLGDAEKWVPAFAGMTIKSVCHLFRVALLALVLWAAALPAWAEDMAATVAGLGGASFADKEKAVVALGKSGVTEENALVRACKRLYRPVLRRALERARELGAIDSAAGSLEEALAASEPA